MKTLLGTSIIVSLLALQSTQVAAQWSNDPYENLPVCRDSGAQLKPQIIGDGLGGAIIVWPEQYAPNPFTIHAQRIDSSGNIRWSTNGIPLATGVNAFAGDPVLVSDGKSGVIVAWADERDFESKGFDIYAQRIDSSGRLLWIPTGVPICTVSENQADPAIASDGAGGAIITWDDNRILGGYADIFAQRVDSAGNTRWAINGIPICIAPSWQSNPTILSDGSGGAIISWMDYRTGSISQYDIFAQRVDSSGNALWDSNGVSICSNGSEQLAPTLVGDAHGGAIVVWKDERNGERSYYAQRVDASGHAQWSVDGVPVSTVTRFADTPERPVVTMDTVNGIYVVFPTEFPHAGYYVGAQRLDFSGTRLWGPNGIAVSSTIADELKAGTDGSGGIIVTWGDYRNWAENIYAQRFNETGTAQWTPNGARVCVAANGQVYPELCTDGRNGAIITWEDFRNQSANNYSDIYAHRIRADGGPVGPPHIVVSPTTVDFGEVYVDSSRVDTILIRNTGGDTLRIDTAVADKPQFTSSPTSAIMAPDSSMRFIVSFAPLSKGIISGHFSFTHNAPGSPTVLAVSGVGLRKANLQIVVSDRWNLISVPVMASDYRKASLFSTSVSEAFAYESGYVMKDTLSNGPGYWLKFSGASEVAIQGIEETEDTINLVNGWNLIGTISIPLSVYALSTDPPGITTSDFFGFRGTYRVTDSLIPGNAYWVKANRSGALIMSSSQSASPRTVRIVSTPERPPSPPDEWAVNNHTPDIPKEFSLDQNWPNPFNPTTTIRYGLPKSSHVTLEIYDMLGQLVAKLVDQAQRAGIHEVDFDAGLLPSGVYFYRIHAADYLAIKKLLLLR